VAHCRTLSERLEARQPRWGSSGRAGESKPEISTGNDDSEENDSYIATVDSTSVRDGEGHLINRLVQPEGPGDTRQLGGSFASLPSTDEFFITGTSLGLLADEKLAILEGGIAQPKSKLESWRNVELIRITKSVSDVQGQVAPNTHRIESTVVDVETLSVWDSDDIPRFTSKR
jgi:hypothetical protein